MVRTILNRWEGGLRLSRGFGIAVGFLKLNTMTDDAEYSMESREAGWWFAASLAGLPGTTGFRPGRK